MQLSEIFALSRHSADCKSVLFKDSVRRGTMSPKAQEKRVQDPTTSRLFLTKRRCEQHEKDVHSKFLVTHGYIPRK